MNPGQRHKARHFAMQAVYQWEMNKEPASEIEAQFLEDQPIGVSTDKDYLHLLITGTIAHIDELDKIYEPNLSRELKDLDMVDKAILRLATYELVYMPEVPYRVVINEAIMLAKEFAAQDSHKFVNGVLDKVIKNTVLADKKTNTSEESNSEE